MPAVRTKNNLKRNAQGTARPFIAGLSNARLTALDELAWQAFTEVSGLNIEKTDNTTITLPSDSDGFQLDEVTTGYGGLQAQTATLTEYMDERNNAPWIPGVKRDLPFSLWVPQGRGRGLSDKHDFTSGTLISLAYLQSDNQDDNFNPSEGDVANPNKISVGMGYHGRHRHQIRGAQFAAGPTLAAPASGAAYIEQREDTGSLSRRWFLLEHGGTAMPKLHERDIFGQWIDGVDFGAIADAPNGLYEVNGQLLSAGGATGTSHWLIDPDDVSNASEITDADFDINTLAQDIYVKSGSEIFIVGGSGFNSTGHGATGAVALSVGKIFLVTNPAEAGVQVGASGVAATSYNAIGGFGDQVVAVGGGSIADDTLGTDAVILGSQDGGATFASITGPSGANELTAVFMTDVDTFWVGSGDGNVWFTYNFGTSWNSVTLGTTLGSIAQINFLWPSGSEQADRVGYIIGRTGSGATSNAKVLRTIEGGASWIGGGSYVTQEVPSTAEAATAWNQIAIAGPQSVLIAGTQGAATDSDLSAFVEYE